ncbi:response regulator transcription factor [Candidatus Sumerlaeota bacterium]|nr:response regulator transcription factor [Candidatus Sumerlaeota bacterium]
MNRITVLLVENHTVVREGLRSLMDTSGEFDVVGEAQNGRDAVQLVQKLHPAVVLMDLSMPELNGFEAARQILKLAPTTRVLVLSAYDDDAYVDHILALGASGYLVKHTSAKVLVTAIREVGKGNPFFSPSIAKRLRDRNRKSPGHAGLLKKRKIELTPREAEALQLIAEGKANKQIAAELAISIKTVEKHRQNLMTKLGIHDTAGLTRYAITAGIIEGGIRMKLN